MSEYYIFIESWVPVCESTAYKILNHAFQNISLTSIENANLLLNWLNCSKEIECKITEETIPSLYISRLKDEYKLFTELHEEIKINLISICFSLVPKVQKPKSLPFWYKKLKKRYELVLSLNEFRDFITQFHLMAKDRFGNTEIKNNLIEFSRGKYTLKLEYKTLIQKKIKYQCCGLTNFNNTCYINSVLQVLAHCKHFSDIDSINYKGNNESKLLITLINKMNSQDNEGIRYALQQFLCLLAERNKIIEIGRMDDSKTFFVTVLDFLSTQGFEFLSNLFVWKSSISFNHLWNNQSHNIDFPLKVIPYFILNSRENKINASDLRTTLINANESRNKIKSLCTQCNIMVEGIEITKVEKAKYITFISQKNNSSVTISSIEEIQFENFGQALLVAIISRFGENISCGHSVTLCKEKKKWILYNDSDIQEYTDSEVYCPYFLIYELIS
ncbi:hypothetical protein SteCoe_38297 [Stentor coeruleus]|uniref:USP domain-containing protein n=1 Tax=Stentor coeruleus TaxID=5963 RepID=A0A1R2ALK2_9CILI|nr:hypothetical protein SteCoe_38297 [Stentor coeruleus]